MRAQITVNVACVRDGEKLPYTHHVLFVFRCRTVHSIKSRIRPTGAENDGKMSPNSIGILSFLLIFLVLTEYGSAHTNINLKRCSVCECLCVCVFNIRAQGTNTPKSHFSDSGGGGKRRLAFMRY